MNYSKFDNYETIVAIKEMSAGNDSVGSMWLEAKTFPKETPVSDIVEWGGNCSGKLIIAIDEATRKEAELGF